jgi:hypothetical protein
MALDRHVRRKIGLSDPVIRSDWRCVVKHYPELKKNAASAARD